MKISNKTLAAILACLLIVFGALALAGEKNPDAEERALQLQITEICTKNDTLLRDNQGRTPDYIELYNPGSDLDLTGYVFTDGKNTSQPLEQIILHSGEYRVFFISPEHTGFALSASGGDTLRLLDAQGNTAAKAQTKAMSADQVMLLKNGSYEVSRDASPGFPNDSAGINAYRYGVMEDNPGLLISEVLISNRNFLPDEKGAFSDVAELYNGSEEPILLSGYWLSDTMENRFAWRLPEQTLQPGQYITIFCDGEDYIAENGTIHASFALNRQEELVLTDAGGRYQKVSLSESRENMSLALQDGEYVSMAPSLGYENTEAGAYAMQRQRIDFDSPLVIRELLFADAQVPFQGKVQDVVEIVNRSEAAVSTANWYLSDGGDPYAYALPVLTLQPGQCITLVCSRETTGFALSQGESLYLTGANGLCAPPVAWVTPEQGKSLQITYNGEETSMLYGDISLGYDNDEAGASAWQQQSLPDGLRISEVMSANSSFLKDASGKTYDYLELYNASNQPISLSGYALTNNPSRPNKYPLPDTAIRPGEYLVLILTDKTQTLSLPYDIVPMTLSSQGESLYLTQGEEIVDYVLIPALATDMAYGRGAGSAEFSYLAGPTPGKANGAGAQMSEKPVAVTAQGSYNGVDYVDVVLSAPGPIYYTTNAQAPNQSAALYTGPIRITKTTVIRAQCREPGKQASEVLDLTYLINEGDQLSVVTLVADPEELLGWGGIYYNYWLDVEIPATVSLFEAEGGGFTESCGLRMFGGYTRAYDKKSFACMFRDQYGASSLRYPLFGEDNLQEFEAFVLRTGGQDSIKGRIRDELITSLVAEYTDVPVQAYRPVTLYLNGEFWGVYFVREKVNENYIAGHYNVRPEEVTLQFGNGTDPEYRSLIQYVKTHDLSVQEYYDYVAERIDIDEFIDYHAAQMWTGNVDMGNIKYYKIDGGKWRWILYDTDLALTMAEYDSVSEQLNPAGTGAYDLFSTDLIVGLMKNPGFREQFLRRLAWQAENIWNTPQIMERIAYLENMIRPDMERDIARWGKSLDFWNAKLGYMRHVVQNRGSCVYRYLKNYFHLTDSQMEELGFSKP